jgi:hypothetical protein
MTDKSADKKTVKIKLVKSVAGTRESHRATCAASACARPTANRRSRTRRRCAG